MNQQINRFTAYTNCPSGEYGAIFNNSEVKKYPKGEREILTFLILGEDGLPFLNNKQEPYYSVIVCNKSKGSSPKSKINKKVYKHFANEYRGAPETCFPEGY